MTDDAARRSPQDGSAIDALRRSVLDHGKFSMQALGAIAGASSVALLAGMLVLLSDRFVIAGPPYRDIPAALIAMGGATSLVALASATAYFSQYASHAYAAGQVAEYDDLGVAAFTRSSRWRSVAQAFHLATFVLMALAYIAFAIGGIVFIHFCLAAMPAMAGRG